MLPTNKFCVTQRQCPITDDDNIVAITSNCSYIFDTHCPLGLRSAKICIDSIDLGDIKEYCTSGVFIGRNVCPKAKKGLEFQQCYVE